MEGGVNSTEGTTKVVDVGECDGSLENVGVLDFDGSSEGSMEGKEDGIPETVGLSEGPLDVVGAWETDGECDGCLEEGTLDGTVDGISDGTELGGSEGMRDGSVDGSKEGKREGICEGCTDGMVEGEDDGSSVGVSVVDGLKELDGLEELGPDNRRDDGPCDEFSGALLGVVGMTVTSFSPIVGPTTPFPLDEVGRIVAI